MRYIIVDDESIAHDIIKKYGGMLPTMQLVADCYDAFEAIELLSKQSVDLIFLDLNMPKLQGFDFLKTLPFQPNTCFPCDIFNIKIILNFKINQLFIGL